MAIQDTIQVGDARLGDARLGEARQAVGPAAIPRERMFVLPWQRLALGAVLILAAILDFWQLDRVGYGNTYYAAAVRSMLQSWHNFFFNAFDPGGFVTIDKPPLGFWLQVASAKVFGFSGLSLMLPQALAGVLAVAVLYRLVSRTFGAGAGLLAALALAVMPVSVAADRNNIIDGTLALTVLLGAWAVLRAAETGRLRWLLLCAVIVGLGFNIKMLEAYLVVPAFGLLYLLAAPRRWPTRIGQLALATVVLLAVSLSWAVAVDATPASQRPYVGSSGTNSELNLALGYNGLERLTGRIFGFGGGPGPAAPATRGRTTTGTGGTGGQPSAAQQATNNGFTRGETGNPDPLRLFNTALGGQVSWLLPLAILGLIAAAWRTRPRFPLDRRQQSLVLWGMWLLTTGAFFSVAGFFHTYYMVMLAPSIAALAGIGLVALWQDYRRPGWRGWLLLVALVVTAGVQGYLLSSYPDWSRWLTPLVAAFTVVAAAALVLGRLGLRLRLLALGAAALGVAGLLAAPTAWAADTVLGGNGGMTPVAGPSARDGVRFPGGSGARGAFSDQYAVRGSGDGRGFGGIGGRGGFGGGSATGGANGIAADTTLVRYLEAHQGKTRFLLATLNSMTAAPIIITTGKPVMALGGFSGADRIVTPSELAALVANGTVRYFLLDGFGGGRRSFNLDDLPPQVRALIEERGGLPRGGFGGFGGGNGDLTQWVSSNCAAVPSSLWQTAASSAPSGGFGFGGPPSGAPGGSGVGGSGAGGFGFGGQSPDAGGAGGGTGGFGGPGGRSGRGGFSGGGEQLYDCASRPSSSPSSSSAPSSQGQSGAPSSQLTSGGFAATSATINGREVAPKVVQPAAVAATSRIIISRTVSTTAAASGGGA